MTPNKLEALKKYYFGDGWSYEEGAIFHMFTSPIGDLSHDFHKLSGYCITMNPKQMVNPVKAD